MMCRLGSTNLSDLHKSALLGRLLGGQAGIHALDSVPYRGTRFPLPANKIKEIVGQFYVAAAMAQALTGGYILRERLVMPHLPQRILVPVEAERSYVATNGGSTGGCITPCKENLCIYPMRARGEFDERA